MRHRNGFVSEVFVVALRLGHLKVAATCALSEESGTAAGTRVALPGTLLRNRSFAILD